MWGSDNTPACVPGHTESVCACFVFFFFFLRACMRMCTRVYYSASVSLLACTLGVNMAFQGVALILFIALKTSKNIA